MENFNSDNQNMASCCHGKKGLISVAVISATILFLALAAYNSVAIVGKIKQLPTIGGDKGTISFTETGEVYVKPDLAIVDFSVVTEKKTVADAMSENTQKMNAVVDSVKALGVEEKDLKTTNFSIYPQYEYQAAASQIYPYPPGKRVLTGYQITQTLEVKIRNLENTGKIIEAATSKGSNEVGDLQFTIDKEDELKNQARQQAIEKAKAKAKELASELGIKLAKITSFSESGISPIFYAFDKSVMKIGKGGAVPPPSIQTGENKISVTVSLTYQIN